MGYIVGVVSAGVTECIVGVVSAGVTECIVGVISAGVTECTHGIERCLMMQWHGQSGFS